MAMTFPFLGRALLFAGTAATALVLASCSKEASKEKSADKFASVEQRASYGVGYNLGQNLARQKGVSFDKAALEAGMDDGMKGAKMRVAEKDLEAAFNVMQQRSQAALEAVAKENLTAATTFLDKNKTKSGVKTTASGLQYEVIKSGKGKKPKATDRVEVHYHGTLLDGTVFDSSVQRGEPATFTVSGLIPGWTEALQLMSVGDKWKLYVPPSLAYGPRPSPKIPPNSTLVFEIELLAVK
jgi:FKBP-type peptidyl-prolyl cis-trans isomerase FklB